MLLFELPVWSYESGVVEYWSSGDGMEEMNGVCVSTPGPGSVLVRTVRPEISTPVYCQTVSVRIISFKRVP